MSQQKLVVADFCLWVHFQ
jgi:hypothetical protein